MASHQSQSQLWNELPPEILGLIFSYLGKQDLFNARMVSHIWNNGSLRLLRELNFTQILRERTIEEYLLFITSSRSPSNPGKFIIPLFPIHLYYNIDLFSSVDLGLKNLTSYVDRLYTIFGRECISSLSLITEARVCTDTNIRGTGLIESLALISPGLKTLDLRIFNGGVNSLNNQEQVTTFTKLKKLICNTSTHVFESGERGSALAYISMIENSPNLEDLTLTDVTRPCDLESWPLNFTQLKSLSLDKMINPQNILDKILSCYRPAVVLRELSFSLINDVTARIVREETVDYNILESVSDTLKSLELRGPLYPGSVFPKLLQLEHLRLDEYPVDSNLSDDTFPSLKSIELAIGYPPSPPVLPFQYGHVRLEFQNSIKLILRVSYISTPEYLNGTLEKLQKTFPNISKLYLMNAGGNDGVKYLLDRIMKSNWSTNIQEIQMIGFRQDYLGQVLATNSIKMTNITTIKLDLSDESYDRFASHYQLTPTITKITNLLSIGKHFPQLRMIEVSKLLLHSMDKNMRERHILEFKSKYPDVVFSLTHTRSVHRRAEPRLVPSLKDLLPPPPPLSEDY